MRVLVVGATSLAVQVASTLSQSGCEVNFVRPDGDTAAQPRDDAIRVVVGDPLVVLEEAGALRTDVLVACTTSDAENLVVSFLGKRHFAIPTVVARVNEPEDEWLFDGSWGVDVAVSASSLLADAVLRAHGAAATRRSDGPEADRQLPEPLPKPEPEPDPPAPPG